jgi:hypothetical protein
MKQWVIQFSKVENRQAIQMPCERDTLILKNVKGTIHITGRPIAHHYDSILLPPGKSCEIVGVIEGIAYETEDTMQQELNFKKPLYPDLGYEWGTQKAKMYALLKTNCSATNSDFVRQLQIFRYGGRIMEMRADLKPHGWTIRKERIKGSLYEYHLERSV